MKHQSNESLAELEKLLVKEFRTLQQLAETTREEREVMPGKSITKITSVVERKELALDQLALMLDKRRLLIQQISCADGITNDNLSMQNLLPFLNQEDHERLANLVDGINCLVAEIRDMNYGNLALTNSLLMFVQSAQAMMLSSLQKQIDYRPTAAQGSGAIGFPSYDQRI
jgi:flagellar biosynthesis/type III secretory pathway chaperone